MNPVVIFLIGGVAGGFSNGLNYYSQGQSFWKGARNGAIIGGASAFIPSAVIGGIVAGAGTQLLNRTWDGVKIFDNGNPLTDCAKEMALTGTIGGVLGGAFDGLAQGIVGSSSNSILIKHIDTYRAAVTNAYVTSYTNIINAYANLGSVLK